MATQYEALRSWMQTNPAVHPNMRKYFGILDDLVTWPATTTTTTTTSTSTTTTTTTSTSTTTTTTTTA